MRARHTPTGARAALAAMLIAGLLPQLATPPASAAPADAELTVSTTADHPAPACADATLRAIPSPLSLREALCLVDNLGGGTVTVPAGDYRLSEANPHDGTVSLVAGRVAGQSLSLRGAGERTRIIGDGISPALTLDPASSGGTHTRIKGVAVTGGSAGIAMGSPTGTPPDRLELDSVTLVGNLAEGLRAADAIVSIRDSVFLENAGGAIMMTSLGKTPAQLDIERSRFAGNGAAPGLPASAVSVLAAPHPEAGPVPVRISGSWFSPAGTATQVFTRGAAVSTAQNWWGCNTNACRSVVSDREIAAAPDLQLSVGASPAVLNRAAPQATVTASLRQDQAGNAVPVSALSAFERAPIQWTAAGLPGASITPGSGVLVAGESIATLTGGPYVGSVKASAALGSTTVSVDVPKGEAPVVHGPTRIEVLPGEAVAFSLAGQSDLVPITMTRVSGAAPRGVTVGFSANTVSFGGRVGSDESGSFPMTFRAHNAAGSALVTVTIDVLNAPLMAATDRIDTAVGTPLSPAHEVRAAIAPGGTGIERIWISEGELPDGLSWLYHPGANRAQIFGSARVGSGSTRVLTVEAVNTAGYRSEQLLTLTVLETGRLELPGLVRGTVGVPLSVEFRATHAYPALTALSFDPATIPAGLSIAETGPGSWRLSGTPRQPEDNTLNLGASGPGAVPVTGSLRLAIAPYAAPSLAELPDQSVPLGEDWEYPIEASGSPVPDVTSEGLPAGFRLDTSGQGPRVLGAGEVVGETTVTLTAQNELGDKTTQDFRLTVGTRPTVTVAVPTEPLQHGDSFTLSAQVSGFPEPTVSWWRTAPGAHSAERLPGESSPELALIADSSDSGASYTARADNTLGSAESDPVTLSVRALPTPEKTPGPTTPSRPDPDSDGADPGTDPGTAPDAATNADAPDSDAPIHGAATPAALARTGSPGTTPGWLVSVGALLLGTMVLGSRLIARGRPRS